MTFWVAGAAVIGTVGGALISSHSVNNAANSQAQGVANAQAEQARQYDLTRADYAPYREAGTKALGTFATENNSPLDVSNLQMEPGYQFGLNQGKQALDRQIAAGGGRISGAALKSAAQFGTDYATTGYSAAYGRANQARTDRLNRLAALAGIGQTATQNVAAAGTAAANANSSLAVEGGNNSGAASVAQGNIWGNATNQLAALYGRNRGTSSSFSPVTEGATNQTGNFDYYGSGYSP